MEWRRDLPLTAIRPAPAGLCGTCVHARTCAWAARSAAVWHCEEFSSGPDAPSRTRATPPAPAAGPADAAGLCANCVHAPTCGLPARATGAWACEEHAS